MKKNLHKYLSVTALLLCLAVTAGVLTGCGSSSYSSKEYAAPAMEMADADYAVNSAASYTGSTRSSGSDSGNTMELPANRKFVITINMDTEVEELDSALEAVYSRVKGLNGYVEDQSISNGSAYSSGSRYRRASLTVRVPADQVDSFTDDMAGISNVVSMSKSLQDITLNYVSTENRVQALETEQTRLLELLAQAEQMSDLLEIEERLTDVRYELENYASRLRLYDNQVDYATVYLTVKQVQEYTPTEEPTTWERIRDGFKSSIQGLGESLTDLVVFLIVASPFLLVYGLIAVVVIVLVRKLRARRKAKKAAKATKAAAPKPEEQ